jgi:hypothetical protein
MSSSSYSEECEEHCLIDDEDSDNSMDCSYVLNCILEMKVVGNGSRVQNAGSGIMKNVQVHMTEKRLCVHSATLTKCCA